MIEARARDDRQRDILGQRCQPDLADRSGVQHDIAPRMCVVAQPGQSALCLGDPRHAIAFDGGEACQFATLRRQQIQHRLTHFFDSRGRQLAKPECGQLQRQRVVGGGRNLTHEAPRRQAGQQPMRGALGNIELRADCRQCEPVRRVGQQFDDFKRALSGGVHRRAGTAKVEQCSNSRFVTCQPSSCSATSGLRGPGRAPRSWPPRRRP